MALKEAFEAVTSGIEVIGVDSNHLLIALMVIGIASWNLYSYASSYIDVPTHGVPPGIFGSWKASLNFLRSSEYMLRDGYAKYSPSKGMFKISTFSRYLVFVTDPKHIAEMKSCPENILSFQTATRMSTVAEYTMNKYAEDDWMLYPIILKSLTNQLSAILSDVTEEATLAFNENLKVGDDWTKVKIWDVMLQVISQTTNRMFVGLPLCRNKEYLDICIRYATKASKTGRTLDITPRILRPFLAWYLLNRPKRLKELTKFLGPIFDERKEKMRTLGDKWTDKPNDSVQWVLEEAKGTSMDTNEKMSMTILLINFAATHTTSMSITHALFDLAAHPHFIPEIREEIKSVLEAEGGWTKQGLTKMKKLDSALKESQRMNGVTAITMTRICMKPFQFTGSKTVFPAGTFLCAPSSAIHHEASIYENPLEYDAFRFSKMREQEGQGAKHQMVSTTEEYLAFGHGKHACPGRFFATNELKLLMSHIILNYDFKLEEGSRPDNIYFGSSCIPNARVELLFKKLEEN
ncbi:hypothetical protein RUND412_003256 [Rhizina undulata]